MLGILYPDEYADSIGEIGAEHLSSLGIKGVLLDIDNTLVPYSTRTPDENALIWMKSMEEAGIKVCIFSNAKEGRVTEFSKNLPYFVIHGAGKPLRKGFKYALSEMDILPEEAAMIGDQLFTDIAGGNLSGLYTILVKPINDEESKFVRFKRLLEAPVLKRYRRKYSDGKKE